MAYYENRQPPEGINTTNEHPLKEFAQLVLGIGALLVASIFVINFFISSLARYIPFTFEQKMVSELDVLKVKTSEQQRYLQDLADRLSQEMELDREVNITVHYSESGTMNALATMGGHVFFFQGLIDEMESEEELAAVMAHEIAHVKYRHPIVALGKGVTMGALAAFISGASGSNAGDWLIGNSINLSLLQFSRDQERQVDAEAAAALFQVYGNIRGADELFKRFAQLEGDFASEVDGDIGENKSTENQGYRPLEIFRSHPFSKDRWRALTVLAQDNKWPLGGSLTPLEFPTRE